MLLVTLAINDFSSDLLINLLQTNLIIILQLKYNGVNKCKFTLLINHYIFRADCLMFMF